MRKQLLTVILPSLLLALSASAAETPVLPASQPNQLQRVNVVRGADEIRVEINARGTVTPKLSTLDSPARLVVDLPETVMATGQSRITVGSAGVKDVRIGMDGHTPPSTRVVVDLERACSYELNPSADGKLVLTLHAKATAQDETASAPKVAPKATAANTPAPARIASPFSPRVMEVAAKSAAPSETAASPMEIATPAAQKKPEAAATSSSDFVFVEPSYQAKAAKSADAPAEPAGRAQEAASRFADKTAAELLPVSMNAAQAASQSTSAGTTIQPAVNLAAEQKAQAGQQPVAAGPKYTGEPISVNLKDVDLKDFFRLIHEISGLNVVLDPNVHGTLTIVLDDVPWDQALDIVLKNNDLARELEGNVLRIATVDTLKKEADDRRAQIEAEALAVEKVSVTRFLSYAHAKDVVVTVKKFLSQRGDVVADERTNAIIVNDIPKVIPVIDRLLTQLDRKTQEVEIEARVVAATRQFARDIGTQLGFGWGNGHSAVGGNAGGRQLSNHGQRFGAGLHYDHAGRWWFLDRGDHTVVLQPGSNLAHQRLVIRQRQQHSAYRRHSFHGGVARVAEGVVAAASRDSEQRAGPGETGCARAHRHSGAVGRPADGNLRRRVPPADGNSADHVGKHHLPERGRGKHHPELWSGSAGQPGTHHPTSHHTGAGDRRWHGGDRRRHPDPELDQHFAGTGAGEHSHPGQPVQTHAGEHLKPGVDLLHHAANHSDVERQI